MKCNKCNYENKNENKYCTNCGNVLNKKDSILKVLCIISGIISLGLFVWLLIYSIKLLYSNINSGFVLFVIFAEYSELFVLSLLAITNIANVVWPNKIIISIASIFEIIMNLVVLIFLIDSKGTVVTMLRLIIFLYFVIAILKLIYRKQAETKIDKRQLKLIETSMTFIIIILILILMICL